MLPASVDQAAMGAHLSSVELVSRRMGVPSAQIEARAGLIYHFPPPAVALARRTALYLVCCVCGIHLRRLARTAGMSAEGVRKAVAAIEDRRDDPEFDAFVEALEQELVAA
jgi:hypothetical protein